MLFLFCLTSCFGALTTHSFPFIEKRLYICRSVWCAVRFSTRLFLLRALSSLLCTVSLFKRLLYCFLRVSHYYILNRTSFVKKEEKYVIKYSEILCPSLLCVFNLFVHIWLCCLSLLLSCMSWTTSSTRGQLSTPKSEVINFWEEEVLEKALWSCRCGS